MVNMPKSDPNEFVYEIDTEAIEREMECAFKVEYDGEKDRWCVIPVEEQDWPHFMVCYMIGMQPEEFQAVLRDEFHAETFWESFSAYYITKEQAEAACEWIESMHVMASMGADAYADK